jgi:O-antigen/teichoic acid export membrane protein
VLTFFADSLIHFVYGMAFDPSIKALRIIAWSLVPYTFSSYFSVTLIMRGAETMVFNANLICLTAAIIIYSLLIPMFGLLGAAWAALAVESLLASLLLIGNRRFGFLVFNVN